MRKPFPRSYWVIPGKVCAGAYPGDPDIKLMEMKIKGLVECGIGHVVNLMETTELNHHGKLFNDYTEVFTSLSSSRKPVPLVMRFPIRDLSIPTREFMQTILDDIDSSLLQDCPVYIHCWGGKGRTGTVVGCFLARHRIAEGKHALSMLSQLRVGDPTAHELSPETSEQRGMVISWKEGV